MIVVPVVIATNVGNVCSVGQYQKIKLYHNIIVKYLCIIIVLLLHKFISVCILESFCKIHLNFLQNFQALKICLNGSSCITYTCVVSVM